jgi:glucose/arabinose dehydrogenase
MKRSTFSSSSRAQRGRTGLYAALGLAASLALGNGLNACSSDGGGGGIDTDDAGVGGQPGGPGGSAGGRMDGGTTSGMAGGTGDGGGGAVGSSDGGGTQGGRQDGGTQGGTTGGNAGGQPEAGQPGGGDGSTADGGGTMGGSGKTVCSAPKPNAMVGNACKNSPPPAVKLTPVVTGLSLPVYVTQAPGDKERLYVVEQRGRIKVVRNRMVEATPFLDIVSKVAPGGPAGEQGLLGLAFDPNYQTTGRFWVKYSKADSDAGDDTVSMFTATPGGAANANSEKVLTQISAPHPNQAIRNHNGGMLAFGPDGCLYIAYGDGGGTGDTQGNGQKISDLFGSLVRIDVENFPTAAPGNLTGNGANPHVWNYGLRNPWRFSFDRATGDLYIGDVGQNSWEEVDVEPAGKGGRNYGWNKVEGKGHCYSPASNCDQTGLTLPAVEYANPAGNTQASVIGGYVYRGSAIPGLVGRYIYADSYSRKVSTFVYSGEMNGAPQVCDEHPLSIDAPGNPFSFGEDLDGELYLTTANGGLYKFEPG